MNNIVNKDIQLPVVGFDGKELRKITLDSEIFGIEPHMPSVHLAVKVDLANRRQATAKTKTRSEVSGGGKKPWRQKRYRPCKSWFFPFSTLETWWYSLWPYRNSKFQT